MWTNPNQALLCLVCVIERKTAEKEPKPTDLPPLRPAVTLLNSPLGPVTPHCYEHIQVQRQSPLAVPGALAMPRPQ